MVSTAREVASILHIELTPEEQKEEYIELTVCERCGRHPTEAEYDGWGPQGNGWLLVLADGEVCPDCGTATERALDRGES